MSKVFHEIRDPIHVFVRLDSDERRVLDSRPVQRLRHIHQLALSSQVYPGATHTRFEHSLGVMELATQVFDVVCRNHNFSEAIVKRLPDLARDDKLRYWRRVLRMAALCHDAGHLPFSHAAEKQLLPDGWTHERLTREIIMSQEMRDIWSSITPPLTPEHILKVAVGPREAKDLRFTTWETMLSEIIVGDAMGVDRMDYLLRDSHHAGVVYGRFDHYRLIDTMRILISPSTDEPSLGLEEGGIQSAEALLLARYLMYSQVYLHAVRRIYDIHLQDFLSAWLTGGRFSTSVEDHLRMTDNEVTSAIYEAARIPEKPGHDPAKRIVNHDHFRVLYERHPADVAKNPEAGKLIFAAAVDKFGVGSVRLDQYTQRGGVSDFPVLMKDGSIISSLSKSEALYRIPIAAADYVYIIPEKREEAEQWLRDNRSKIIEHPKEEA
jgi:HD superfamily phosphohydrolase